MNQISQPSPWVWVRKSTGMECVSLSTVQVHVRLSGHRCETGQDRSAAGSRDEQSQLIPEELGMISFALASFAAACSALQSQSDDKLSRWATC